MAKLIQKGNKIIVKNECTPQFKRELTILIKEIMKQYSVKSHNKDTTEAFIKILKSNICVIVDNHFLDKDPIVDKWFKDCVLLQNMNGKELNLLTMIIEKFLTETLNSYSKVLGISKEEILKKFEEKRNYCAINYYQVANFPKLENVEVFDTIKQLRDRFPSGKFVCPHCKGISTDSNRCNSGVKLKLINGNNKKEICNWCSGGLFGNLNGGYNFIVKEDFLNNPIVHKIFKPIELNLEEKK